MTNSQIVRLHINREAKEYLLEQGKETVSDLHPWSDDEALEELLGEDKYQYLAQKVADYAEELEELEEVSEKEKEPIIEDVEEPAEEIVEEAEEPIVEEIEVDEEPETAKAEGIELADNFFWDVLSPRLGEPIPEIVKEKYYGQYFAPKNLLDYAIKEDVVIIILGNGGKHSIGL